MHEVDELQKKLAEMDREEHRLAGVRPSMGSVGDAYDNAMCESFFATLECELLDRDRFRTQADARLAIFDYIEGWYNSRRRQDQRSHSALRIDDRHRTSPCAVGCPISSDTSAAPRQSTTEVRTARDSLRASTTDKGKT